jgi:endonuclease/exonuclease/phosphatase family metal-dependent hydrolase
MKIITLNIWGGEAGRENLLSFFDTNKDVDIFCLQEVWSAPYPELEGVTTANKVTDQNIIMTEALQDISNVLVDHTPYFRPHYGDHFGLLMFVKNSIEFLEEGDTFVHLEKGHIPEGDQGHHARNLQYVKIKTNEKNYTVLNFHGLWNGQGKGDSDARIQQSEKIISFINGQGKNNFVLAGDFNLSPDTKSLNMIEEELNAKNLIKDYGITSTRTSLYKKENRLADYIFTGSDIVVKDFKVLPDEVSDHSPLYLQIE